MKGLLLRQVMSHRNRSEGTIYGEYYLDQKIPGIHSENSKYKFYSSKVILSPSKYSPSIYCNCMQPYCNALIA